MRTLILFFLLVSLNSCTYYFGINHFERHFMKDKSLDYHRTDAYVFTKSRENNYSLQPMVMHWADMELPDWQKSAKVSANRVVLAKLAAGKDVFEVNSYLLKAVPNAVVGTKWKLNPNGDYDFTEVVLAFMLNKFSKDTTVLLPVVAKHIAETLITSGGDKPHLKTPGTLGLLRETENHVLMGTTALYLKNQWVLENLDNSSKYNNQLNGVEQFLIDLLSSLKKSGFYEFNSDPYSGYSLTAILMLHSQSNSQTIKKLCEDVLDQTFYKYALSSSDFRFYPPIRRRYERAEDPELDKNPVNSLALTFYALAKNQPVTTNWVKHNFHQSLIAVLSSYALPQDLVEMMESQNGNYLLKVGRGPNSSPEIYSAGNQFLISAGGVKQKPASQLGVRPITLMLKDEAKDLKDLYHLRSNRKTKKRNNTGVWQNMAVIDGKSVIPVGKVPSVEAKNWKIFQENQLFLAIYQDEVMALMAVFPEWNGNANDLLNKLNANNPENSIRQTFKFPDSQVVVSYKLNSSRKRWMIKAVNGAKVDRKFLKWQRFDLQRFD